MSNNQEKKKEILGPSRVELLVTREYRDVVLGKAVVLIIEDKVDADRALLTVLEVAAESLLVDLYSEAPRKSFSTKSRCRSSILI